MIDILRNNLKLADISYKRADWANFRDCDDIVKGGEVIWEYTPYDAATTAYLKATYPAYWYEIRAFGKSHPNLVPFVNEDNDLIVSLVEVGKERLIKNVGKAYIDTGFVPTNQSSIDTEFNKQGKENYPWGSAISYNSQSMETYNSELHWGIMVNVSGHNNGRVHMWSNREQYYWTNNGTSYSHTFPVYTGTFPYTLTLFALHRASITISSNELKMWYFKLYDNDVLVRHFVPCKNPNGSDYGMLDLVNLQWYGNANTSGAFTIELTDTPS